MQRSQHNIVHAAAAKTIHRHIDTSHSTQNLQHNIRGLSVEQALEQTAVIWRRQEVLNGSLGHFHWLSPFHEQYATNSLQPYRNT
jgi:hypothetical protein